MTSDTADDASATHAAGPPAPLLEVEARLRAYGTPRHHNPEEPLDDLVFILLSTQTEEYNYLQTYEALRAAFPGWRGLAEAPPEQVEALLRRGGLYRRKARQLQAALSRVVADAGAPTLDFLRTWDDERVYRYLTGFDGVGNKAALCVMLYALGRAVFPVDTHVWRVARRLGWTPPKPRPTLRDERALQVAVPPGSRYALHVNVVAHGRATCLTYWPRCDTCLLANLCPSRGRPDRTWGEWRRPGGTWAKALGEVPPARPG
jgi:endonuclease III